MEVDVGYRVSRRIILQFGAGARNFDRQGKPRRSPGLLRDLRKYVLREGALSAAEIASMRGVGDLSRCFRTEKRPQRSWRARMAGASHFPGSANVLEPGSDGFGSCAKKHERRNLTIS
jgi:hypothetical protein